MEIEAVVWEGRELFTDVKVLCAGCAEQVEREERAEKDHTTRLELQGQWERICPARFRDTDPAKLPDIAGMNEVISWQYGPDGILAHGPTGTGKTRCLFLLLRRLHFEEHRSIVTMPAAGFGAECGRVFYSNQSEAAAWIARLIRVDVLMIDDLDKAKFTERVEAELFHVIDGHTADGRPILGSMNATSDEVAGMMSEHRGLPIVRRLRDYCRPICFERTP